MSQGMEKVQEYTNLLHSSVPLQVTPYEKVSNEDLWDHLVKQKALIASTIETISTDLLKQTLEEKKVLSGAQHIAEVVSDKVTNKATEILCSFLDTTEATEAIIAVATAAGHSVATGIMATPPPVKLSFQESDSQSVLWADKLALHCVRSGLRTQLSEYQREGLLSEVHKVHANMVNDITEVTAHNRATQVQVATLTSAVTELLHKP